MLPAAAGRQPHRDRKGKRRRLEQSIQRDMERERHADELPRPASAFRRSTRAPAESSSRGLLGKVRGDPPELRAPPGVTTTLDAVPDWTTDPSARSSPARAAKRRRGRISASSRTHAYRYQRDSWAAPPASHRRSVSVMVTVRPSTSEPPAGAMLIGRRRWLPRWNGISAMTLRAASEEAMTLVCCSVNDGRAMTAGGREARLTDAMRAARWR